MNRQTRIERHREYAEKVEEQVNKLFDVQTVVGNFMKFYTKLRLHKNRELLIRLVKVVMPCSMESITRSQRKLWRQALDELAYGNAHYANLYLPDNEKDFIEFCEVRHIGQEAFVKFSKKLYGSGGNPSHPPFAYGT